MSSPTPSHPAPHLLRHWPGRERTDGEHERVLDLGRLLLGVTVATLGVLYLLDAAGALNAARAIDRWWPLLIVAAGLLTLAEQPPSRLRGTVLTAVGVVLLLFTTDLLQDDAWSYIWPALLVLAGAAIVVRWQGRTIVDGAHSEDVVRSTAIFGGQKQACGSRAFRGAWLTAVFGGVTLDLRQATPVPEGASVNATAAFGGIDVLVPRGWRISVRSTPIFGGLHDKTDHSQPLAPDAPTLHIDGVCLFGGLDVKHEK